MGQTTIVKGLASPVFETQTAFRHILWAMSHPGAIVELAASAEMPAGLPLAAGMTLLTLADHDTPVWLPPDRHHAWGSWLAFHTGARLTSEREQAAFAIVAVDAPGAPLPTTFATGDERHPERSTTLIVLCPALEGGRPATLEGPGIETRATIAPVGLPDEIWLDLAENHALYPSGVDLLLAAGSRLMALPRSTAVTVPEIG